MANITIRDLPNSAKEALRVRAAKAGVSLESYLRQLLQSVAHSSDQSSPADLLQLSRDLFGDGKVVELDLPSRHSNRPAVEFEA